jgi:hypothetical protein
MEINNSLLYFLDHADYLLNEISSLVGLAEKSNRIFKGPKTERKELISG